MNKKNLQQNSSRGVFLYKTKYKREALINACNLILEPAEESQAYFYILDLSRDITEKQITLLEESVSKENLYIYQPKGSEDLLNSLEELEEHALQNSEYKHILLLNDWESVCYLFQTNYHFNGIIDILHKFKLAGDFLEIQIIANASCKERGLLIDWATTVINLPETHSKKNIQTTIAEEESLPEMLSFSKEQKEESAYKYLKERLLKATDKENLLTIRRVIQSFSSNLSGEQKDELNILYKEQLEAVKTAST